MKDSPSLGETIRDRRLALGYSLGQLATKVNKTASSIRAWERGDALPSEEESEELAIALDLDAELLATLRLPPKLWESGKGGEVDVHDPWPDGESRSAKSSKARAASEAAEEPAPTDAAESGEEAAAGDEPGEDVESKAEAAAPGGEHADADNQPDAGEADDPADEVGDAGSSPEVPAAGFAELFDAKTEAVPVVPASGAAFTRTQADPVLATTSAQPMEQRPDNPVLAAWDDLRALYYRIFDPRRRWIYRVRFVLLLIAFLIMLRVLGWAVGELWNAIGEVLDSISFSPSETPDVESWQPLGIQ